MNTISVAIYLDVENIKGTINIADLLDDIRLKVTNEFDDVEKAIFGLKKAIGDRRTLQRFRTQLSELNFTIEDTPHISKKKNRADLIISVDALEKLHIGNPRFDLFVFLTSDSDYSIVMNTLRKFNKQVWLVATEDDSQRTVFKSSTDKILLVDDYKGKQPEENKKTKRYTKPSKPQKDLAILNQYTKDVRDRRALVAILKVLKSYQEEKVYTTKITNNRFRQIEENLVLSQTKFKNFKSIYRVLNKANVIDFVEDTTHQFSIADKQKINRILNIIS